jgi:hypothetical protein
MYKDAFIRKRVELAQRKNGSAGINISTLWSYKSREKGFIAVFATGSPFFCFKAVRFDEY